MQNEPAAQQDYGLIARMLGVTCNKNLVETLIRYLRIAQEDVVLDIGCGAAGDAGLIVQATRALVIGVDRSVAMLRLCRRPVMPILADGVALPLRKDSVDAGYSVNLLQLLPDRRAMLREIARVLRPGGRLALQVTSRSQLRARFLNRFFPGLLAVDLLRYPAIPALRQELLDGGFSKVAVAPLDLGQFTVDEGYVVRQRSGVLSGLAYLPPEERRDGLRRLENFVAQNRERGRVHRVRWLRNVIVAIKQS